MCGAGSSSICRPSGLSSRLALREVVFTKGRKASQPTHPEECVEMARGSLVDWVVSGTSAPFRRSPALLTCSPSSSILLPLMLSHSMTCTQRSCGSDTCTPVSVLSPLPVPQHPNWACSLLISSQLQVGRTPHLEHEKRYALLPSSTCMHDTVHRCRTSTKRACLSTLSSYQLSRRLPHFSDRPVLCLTGGAHLRPKEPCYLCTSRD